MSSSVVIEKLSEELYDNFEGGLPWEARVAQLHETGYVPDEFCVSLQPAVSASPVLAMLLSSLYEPSSLLAMRGQIAKKLFSHTETLGIQQPLFTGREAGATLRSGKALEVPADGGIWASPLRTFKDAIGGSMNNPFNYIRHYSLNRRDATHQFVAAIAVFDGQQLELTGRNNVDATHWRAKEGKTILGSLACLYYFNPKDFCIPGLDQSQAT